MECGNHPTAFRLAWLSTPPVRYNRVTAWMRPPEALHRRRVPRRGEQLRPVIGWIASCQHAGEHRVGIARGGRLAQCVAVVDPGIDHDPRRRNRHGRIPGTGSHQTWHGTSAGAPARACCLPELGRRDQPVELIEQRRMPRQPPAAALQHERTTTRPPPRSCVGIGLHALGRCRHAGRQLRRERDEQLRPGGEIALNQGHERRQAEALLTVASSGRACNGTLHYHLAFWRRILP